MRELLYFLNPHWRGNPLTIGVPRDQYLQPLLANLEERRDVQMLIGSRRAGKSTLIFQAIRHLINERKIPVHEILYVSLDHLALAETPIPKIIETFRAEFQHPRDRRLFVFLDEIQGSPNWAQHLKNIVDFENLRLCVAGSSSLLLERQGTYLTGRALRTVIFPLSYAEFLAFKNAAPSPTEQYRHDGLLIEYLYQGGYPEQILSPHPTYLADLLDAVINKDIIRVHGIKNPDVLNKLLVLLAQRIGQRTSHSKLKNILRVSQDVVRDYIGYLMEAYLLGEVAKFSYSANEQIYAEKKYYFADTGLRTAIMGQRDLGGLAENALYIYLQKRFGQVFYGRANSYEVDFVVLQQGQPWVFEAKFTDQINDDELKPLSKFVENFPGQDVASDEIKVTVATRNLAEIRHWGKMRCELVPLWKLLLQS
jgi:hypothetical protein